MSETSKLLAPGIEISSVYYDDLNMHKPMEDVVYDNRFITNFSSLSFGSQGISLIIPNDKVVNECIVGMQFQGFVGDASNRLGIIPAVAYSVIDAIEWQIAGSVRYREEGLQHMWDVLADCETLAKRDEVIRLAGGAGSTQFNAAQTFYAHINVPWSKINGASNMKKGIDTKLVSQPLIVNIYLKQNTDIYYTAAGTVTIPTALSKGWMKARQGQFLDQNHRLNLRPLVKDADGNIVQEQKYYFYPFTFYQHQQVTNILGSVAPNDAVIVNLTGFRKGNLQSIRAVLFDNTAGVLAKPATSATNYLQSSELINPVLLFNGIQIFRGDQDDWKLMGIEEDKAPQFVRSQVPGTSYYYLDICFSKILPKLLNETWEQGYDFSNQTLQMSFNTPAANNYTLKLSYIYHAHVMFDGVNAEVQF